MDAKDRPIMDWKNAVALTICYFATFFFCIPAIDGVKGAVIPFAVSLAGFIWLGWPIWKSMLFPKH
jgi:hypothetical protein